MNPPPASPACGDDRSAPRHGRETACNGLGWTPCRIIAVQEQEVAERGEILRILVVDDSAISRKLAELAFTDKPYVVEFAADARQARNLLPRLRPDIVITDWVMPDLAGLELCRRIRNQVGQRDTYLILLSSNATEGQKAEGFAAGADGYLTKPLQTHELLGQIRVARGVLESRKKMRASHLVTPLKS